MPQYRVVSEVNTSSNHRRPRGQSPQGPGTSHVTTVEADTFVMAAAHVWANMPLDDAGNDHRIVSVEEVHPGFSYSDEEITAALTDPERNPNYPGSLIERQELPDDTAIYGGSDFMHVVNDVAGALRETGLVPGLHLSLLQNSSGFVDYAMVEIRDETRGIYLSRGTELKYLTDDRGAIGWDGVLAIARELIVIAHDLH